MWNPIDFQGQGHRVKFLGEGIRHTLGCTCYLFPTSTSSTDVYVWTIYLYFQIKRDEKIGKLNSGTATAQCVEILTALKKLGESLTPEEEIYLQNNSSASLKQFEQVSSDIGNKNNTFIILHWLVGLVYVV